MMVKEKEMAEERHSRIKKYILDRMFWKVFINLEIYFETFILKKYFYILEWKLRNIVLNSEKSSKTPILKNK